MRAYSDNLYERLQENLQEISGDQNKSLLRRMMDSVVAVRTIIMDLKEFILSYQFTTPQEEIEYFKEVQPEFYSLMIYYIRAVFIESRHPVGSKEDRRLFLEKELHQILAFYEQNQDIYRYYRLEETALDQLYFLRGQGNSDVPTEDAYLLFDNRFSTEVGYKIARIKANELLRSFVEEKMEELETGRKKVTYPLRWRPKKVYLAEIIYLFHAYEAFGNLKMKTIVDAISTAFNCPIANISKMVEEMRIRKKGHFPGIMEMLSAGERKMDEDDLKAR